MNIMNNTEAEQFKKKINKIATDLRNGYIDYANAVVAGYIVLPPFISTIEDELLALFHSHEAQIKQNRKEMQMDNRDLKENINKWNHIPTHPCLCSICLDTRDNELKRFKQDIFKKVEGLTDKLTVGVMPETNKYANGWNACRYEYNKEKQELRSSLKALEEKEIK